MATDIMYTAHGIDRDPQPCELASSSNTSVSASILQRIKSMQQLSIAVGL